MYIYICIYVYIYIYIYTCIYTHILVRLRYILLHFCYILLGEQEEGHQALRPHRESSDALHTSKDIPCCWSCWLRSLAKLDNPNSIAYVYVSVRFGRNLMKSLAPPYSRAPPCSRAQTYSRAPPYSRARPYSRPNLILGPHLTPGLHLIPFARCLLLIDCLCPMIDRQSILGHRQPIGNR